MMYMNELEIATAQRAYRIGSKKDTTCAQVKLEAVIILDSHVTIVNENSDGWVYWKPALRAAKRLMEFIQGPDTIPVPMGRVALKTALRPLKAFYTKHPMLPRPDRI